MTTSAKQEVGRKIRADRAFWRALRDDVGRDHMNEPGAMGDWTFKDLVSHLAGWRNRRIAQLEATARGGPEPSAPWPADFEDDETINAWIRERDRDRTLDDLLADYDATFERLAAAIEALPEPALIDANYFPWTDGSPLIEGDFGSHLHEDHAPSVREWLAKR
jgi:hypothetical protein